MYLMKRLSDMTLVEVAREFGVKSYGAKPCTHSGLIKPRIGILDFSWHALGEDPTPWALRSPCAP